MECNMRTHKEIFTEIYDKNIWGGSGGGSTPENTVEYRAFLQKFLRDYNIKTVVDYGCGDWGFSHLIDWSGIEYLGIDTVESVIKMNIIKWKRDNILFSTYMYPTKADLLILKDVLQHWSNANIHQFMEDLDYRHDFKYILITNTQGESECDIEPGQCRGLSAKFEPLKKYNPEILAVIQTTITSEVSLITNL
jgi:hypothetical protein